MDRLLTIGKASEVLGVSISTLHPKKTTSGHRRYDISKLKPYKEHMIPRFKKIWQANIIFFKSLRCCVLKAKGAVVSRKADRWFVSVQVEKMKGGYVKTGNIIKLEKQ